MVVPGQRDHAAQRRGARGVGVAQRINAAVHSGALAIPDAKHAVHARAGEVAHMLRTPDGGGRQVLVHAGLKDDVVLFQDGRGLPQVHVVAAQGRAAVARYIAPGVLAFGRVA